jgi:hypothetical protein
MLAFPVDFESRVSSRWGEIDAEHRLFFIHVPKTAGTAVKWHLEQRGLETYHVADAHPFPFLRMEHLTLAIFGRINGVDIRLQVQQSFPMYPDRWEQMLKFSLTRNPFSWLVSWYLHGTPETEDGWGNVNYIYGIRSFPEFVEKFCSPKVPWNHALNTAYWKNSMYAQWFGRDSSPIINFAIRSEMLNDGIETLFSAVGFENIGHPERDKANYSSRRTKDYRDYYDLESKKIVEKYFARELNVFGYDFDGPTDDRIIYDIERMHLSYTIDSDLFMHKGTQLNRG